MSQQLRVPCPECKQHHDNPKQVEPCLIAALNRWLVLKINNEHTSDYNKAYITFSNLITYYLPILMRDTPTKYYTIQFQLPVGVVDQQGNILTQQAVEHLLDKGLGPTLSYAFKYVDESKPCPKCGQVPKGQHGEHPCPVCGLPLTWDAE